MEKTPHRPNGYKLGVVALLLSLSPWCGYASCSATGGESLGAFAFYGLTLLLAVAGIVMGIVAATKGSAGLATAAILAGIGSPIATFLLGVASGNFGYTRGRAFRRRGKARLPGTVRDDGWRGEIAGPLTAPDGVADAWRINAATETASVASFAHLSNELLALGAPSELIERAHQDAIDEVRHARLCFALAEAIDGQRLGAAPFPYAARPPDRRVTIAQVALDALIEACLYEAASAHIARHLSALATDDRIRGVLDQIAVDEARHAEHGWEVVDWCLSQEGEPLRRRLEAALHTVRPEETAAPVDHDRFETFGVPGTHAWRRSVAAALADARTRLSVPAVDLAA